MISVRYSAKNGFWELCLFSYLEFTWKKTPGSKDCFAVGGKVEISVFLTYQAGAFLLYQQHTGFCWVQPGRKESFHQCSLITRTKHPTHQGAGGVSILCISRARLPMSAGDAVTQQDLCRLSTEPRLSSHTLVEISQSQTWPTAAHAGNPGEIW